MHGFTIIRVSRGLEGVVFTIIRVLHGLEGGRPTIIRVLQGLEGVGRTGAAVCRAWRRLTLLDFSRGNRISAGKGEIP